MIYVINQYIYKQNIMSVFLMMIIYQSKTLQYLNKNECNYLSDFLDAIDMKNK